MTTCIGTQRYSFGYKGYTIDLTMVRSADRDRYPSGKGRDSPLRSTPFIALDAMRNKSDKYLSLKSNGWTPMQRWRTCFI